MAQSHGGHTCEALGSVAALEAMGQISTTQEPIITPRITQIDRKRLQKSEESRERTQKNEYTWSVELPPMFPMIMQ